MKKDIYVLFLLEDTIINDWKALKSKQVCELLLKFFVAISAVSGCV